MKFRRTSIFFTDFCLKGPTSSWLGSILFHFLVFLIILILMPYSSKPGNVMGERRTENVGIVFSSNDGYETPLEVQPKGELSSNKFKHQSVMQELMEDSLSNNNIESLALLTPRIGMNSFRSEEGRNPTAELIDGIEKRQGTSQGNNNQSGQTVGFSDVKGTGRNFVYVLDRSDSMKWNDERPMRYAVQEAQKSIQSLNPQKGALKFQLVFYNHEAEIFQNTKLLEVNEANKRKVCRFLQSLFPVGGTNPLKAIERAVALKPDVIFFLTDAEEEISPSTLSQIRQMRIRNGVGQIHVIEFGRRGRSNSQTFRRLAQENDGMYIFKDIDEL